MYFYKKMVNIMRKKHTAKLLNILTIITIFLFASSGYSVKAVTNGIEENRNEVQVENNVEEPTILKYDATTGETIEINMEEIRQNMPQIYEVDSNE